MPVMLSFALLLATAADTSSARSVGYYRHPAIHGDVVVFAAEGDLWQVARSGGVAARLTSHPADEAYPAISPDGTTLAFSAAYEGPTEVYTMPLGGGSPLRRTFEGGGAQVVGFTPGGALVYATRRYSTLPDTQLFRLDLASGARTPVPLAQAADGAWTPDGRTLFFTRLPFQGSHTKRYRGGTAQSLWKYTEGAAEAVPLTADYAGTSKTPLPWNGRVYFLSDRDGSMNVWSMDEDGRDLRQHTHHKGWDAEQASLSDGRIVYKLGADLRLLDLASDSDSALEIRLSSDFDQARETWLKKPMDYLSSIALSPQGDRIALTARGQVFVAPAKQGRLVEVTRQPGVRYRRATFLPDGKALIALSDESGEVELWKLPANGVGQREPLTHDGKGAALGGRALARRQVDRAPRQGPQAVALERRPEDQHPDRNLPPGRRPGPRVVARQPVARLHRAGRQHARPAAAVPDRGRNHDRADDRSLRQRECDLEPGRRVALLPVRPQPQEPGALALGLAAARSVPAQPDRGVRGRAQEGRALPVRASGRAASRRAEEGRAEEGSGDGDESSPAVREDGERESEGRRGRRDAPKAGRDRSRGAFRPDLQGAGSRRALRDAADRRQAALLAGRRQQPRVEEPATGAGDRTREARGQDRDRGSPRVPAVRRQQEAARPQGERPLRLRRGRQGAGQARRVEARPRPLELQLRPARAVAPDVRRGLAAGAGLLLRPRHARPRLAEDPREVRAARGPRPQPRRARRSARPDGERAVGAPHLRGRGRPPEGAGRRRGGLARRGAREGRGRRRLPGRAHLRRRSRPAPVALAAAAGRGGRRAGRRDRVGERGRDALGAPIPPRCSATRPAARCCCA